MKKIIISVLTSTFFLSGCVTFNVPEGSKLERFERDIRVDLYKDCVKRTGRSAHCANLYF